MLTKIESYLTGYEDKNMATLEGKITQTDTKQSKKGNTYHRLCIETAGGGSNWWTYFGTLHGNPIGAQVVCSTKPMGDGEIIDEYHITTEGQPAAPAAPSGAAPASAAPALGVGGHKDMWIFAECVYQHWIAAAIEGNPDADSVKEMVAHSVSAAIFANEAFKTYGEKGAAEARAMVRGAIGGSPEAKVAELAEQATQASQEGAGAELDDDIPF